MGDFRATATCGKLEAGGSPMGWKPEVWVAISAACVATGALLLQLRNWLVSGPRLRTSVISDGLIIGGGPEFDEDDLILVNATNVGTASTMFTNLIIEERFPFYYFWRRRPIRTYVVLNPNMKGYSPRPAY